MHSEWGIMLHARNMMILAG